MPQGLYVFFFSLFPICPKVIFSSLGPLFLCHLLERRFLIFLSKILSSLPILLIFLFRLIFILNLSLFSIAPIYLWILLIFGYLLECKLHESEDICLFFFFLTSASPTLGPRLAWLILANWSLVLNDTLFLSHWLTSQVSMLYIIIFTMMWNKKKPKQEKVCFSELKLT